MNHETLIFNESQAALQEQLDATTFPITSDNTTGTASAPKQPLSGQDESNHADKPPLCNEQGHDWESSSFVDCRFVMNTFELYETKTHFYLIGTNQSKQSYRVLKIDRTNPKELVVVEDAAVYTSAEKARLLSMIDDGNAAVGGIQPVAMSVYGIVGFIRFTQGWYMIFITKRKKVAVLGGHFIYHIEETRLVPMDAHAKVEKNSHEARYFAMFQSIDLTKNFYFSYTYDLTHTLQANMTRPPIGKTADQLHQHGPNDMFMWNHYLLGSGFKDLNSRSGWILPLIYGFVDQAKISVFGRPILVILIARRSRHFAGARYLKRGVNDKGYVANEVETEQIVADMTTTSFHSQDKLFGNPRYTSYVQHRGSIPLIWSQDATNIVPKPPIELNVVDPFFSAAGMHFEDLLHRYGTPCIVLNLIKQKEKTKRESILGKEFAEAIEYLNQFLPKDKRIRYIAWDMSRASKSHDQDVIRYLENIAQEVIDATGFFHSGPEPYLNAIQRANGAPVQRRMNARQQGVLRTNCIDCLDRTNAAQFLMGKCALGHQLHALGVISSPKVDFDTDAVNILTEMYHDHGDMIALQYGGSFLVNTMETYRKINQLTSHPRDMIESVKRFYANTFSDADKQDAINLFLGNFVTKDGQPMLWELNSDYHLHNQDPRIIPIRRDYRKWCDPAALEPTHNELDPTILDIPRQYRTLAKNVDESDPCQGYWVEYYGDENVTSLEDTFAFKMNSTLKYRQPRMTIISMDGKSQLAGYADISPFTVRGPHRQPPIDLSKLMEEDDEQTSESDTKDEEKPKYWTIESVISRNLDPSVSNAEQNEYRRYTQQFKSIEKLTSKQNEFANFTLVDTFPEYQQYLSYIHRNKISEHPSALKTSHADEQMYRNHIDLPKRMAHAQFVRESNSSGRKRFDGYATYLRTGRFPQPNASHRYTSAHTSVF